MSRADDRYYERQARLDAQREERRRRLEEEMPRRLALLAQVKAGTMTLAEAQRLIRAGQPGAHRPNPQEMSR